MIQNFQEMSVEALEWHINAASKILNEKKAHLRWETGFRNIATIMVGPRAEFEIEDIIEQVRYLKESYPCKEWCECYKKEAWPDECDRCTPKI